MSNKINTNKNAKTSAGEHKYRQYNLLLLDILTAAAAFLLFVFLFFIFIQKNFATIGRATFLRTLNNICELQKNRKKQSKIILPYHVVKEQ